MDLVQSILFESPLKLFVAVVLLLAILATLWWFRPGQTTGWLVAGGLFLSAILLIVQHMVVTDREQIRQMLNDLAFAVDCEDLDAIAPRFHEDCDVDGMSKPELLRRLENAFERAEIDEVQILRMEIRVEDDASDVRLRAHSRVRARDWPYDYYVSGWDLQLVKVEGDWLLHRVRHAEQQGVTARELINIAAQ